MKKIIYTTVFVFFLGLPVISQSPASIKLNLKENKIYKVKSVTDQNILVTYAGNQQKVDNKSSYCVSLKPIMVNSDFFILEICFDTIKVEMSMPKMEINSASPGDIKSGDPAGIAGSILNRLSTNKLVAKVSVSGKFMGFENYNTVKANLTALLDSVPLAKRDQAQMIAGNIIKESNLQSMIEPFFAYFPEKDVSIGDSWETSYMQSGQANMLYFNTYTLNAVEDNYASISGKTDIEAMPSNEPVKEGMPQTTFDVKGSSISELTIDLNTGLILTCTSTGHSEGNIFQKFQDNEMNMPVAIDSRLTINKME